jgi:hypothetical protein
MTRDVPYQYTDRDLLAEPESYEYSEVYGQPFLDAYRADRDEALATVDRRLDERATGPRATAWDALLAALSWAETDDPDAYLTPLGNAPDFEELPDPESAPVETVPVLAALAGYGTDHPPDGATATDWLDHFVTRFEIDKRLAAGYDTNGTGTQQSAPEIAYPLLALASLLQHGRTGNLKHLNVALKLCDLLSSKRETLEGTNTLALARLAIAEERGAVRSLPVTAEAQL